MPAKELEAVESFAELKAEAYDTIEDEYKALLDELWAAEKKLAEANTHLSRRRAKRELTAIQHAMGELKPHLKVERRELFNGKRNGQRTRHDVMEDMLIELREIKALIQAKASAPSSLGFNTKESL